MKEVKLNSFQKFVKFFKLFLDRNLILGLIHKGLSKQTNISINLLPILETSYFKSAKNVTLYV